MNMTDISESCSIRLNLQENRIYRESVIDTIISFMNIIWGSLTTFVFMNPKNENVSRYVLQSFYS